jgi:hypothetical protein
VTLLLLIAVLAFAALWRRSEDARVVAESERSEARAQAAQLAQAWALAELGRYELLDAAQARLDALTQALAAEERRFDLLAQLFAAVSGLRALAPSRGREGPATECASRWRRRGMLQ